jgi:EAL domain-containing protein (putative c-di-GMP-specific phosphodiesterase class I)
MSISAAVARRSSRPTRFGTSSRSTPSRIDRHFIARIAESERHAQMVSTIRELARQTGLPVIAEGVKTQEQLDAVRALGCEYAQSYFFSPPLEPGDTAALLLRGPHW